MFNALRMMTFLLVISFVPVYGAETIEGLPLHVAQIEPGVVRLWVGDHVSSTAVTAIATAKGIVVIDTTEFPVIDKAFRNVIARELGRSDFRYLINTHGHSDHTNGNSVYADCDIIAHETVPEMMLEHAANFPGRMEWIRTDMDNQKKQIESGELDPEQKATAEERLIIERLSMEFMQAAPKPVVPTTVFKENYTLDCGDVTFELYWVGGTHTRSDIFIFVPQKGILFTGDMMADKWLSNVPGCLATFAIHSGEIADYPVLLKHWQMMLDRKDQIRHYIPGHWNGELSYEGFRNRFEYLAKMLTDVKALADSGDDLNSFMTDYTINNKFPQLVDSPGFNIRGHQMSINHLYTIYSGKIALFEAMMELVQQDRFATGFDALKSEFEKDRSKYFYFEAELNNLGYFLLQQKKQTDDAIRLLEFNMALYPDSWNVYDSLGEAVLAKGDKARALELYRKSLQLNPDNENGDKIIAQIESEMNGK